MNTYITLACLLAVLGLSQGNPVGYGIGAPWIGHALPAISTANLVKAAPIPIVRTHYAPIVTAPVVTAPVIRTVGLGYGGLGLGGLGYGWGGHGLGWGGHDLGWGGYGLGWGGHGLGWGGYGAWGKH